LVRCEMNLKSNNFQMINENKLRMDFTRNEFKIKTNQIRPNIHTENFVPFSLCRSKERALDVGQLFWFLYIKAQLMISVENSGPVALTSSSCGGPRVASPRFDNLCTAAPAVQGTQQSRRHIWTSCAGG
jgi:hypothetical protein